MRGSNEGSGRLFSYIDLESRVRRDHPLRAIREIANTALAALAADFSELYSSTERRLARLNGCCWRCCFKPSIPFAPSGN